MIVSGGVVQPGTPEARALDLQAHAVRTSQDPGEPPASLAGQG